MPLTDNRIDTAADLNALWIQLRDTIAAMFTGQTATDIGALDLSDADPEAQGVRVKADIFPAMMRKLRTGTGTPAAPVPLACVFKMPMADGGDRRNCRWYIAPGNTAVELLDPRHALNVNGQLPAVGYVDMTFGVENTGARVDDLGWGKCALATFDEPPKTVTGTVRTLAQRVAARWPPPPPP